MTESTPSAIADGLQKIATRVRIPAAAPCPLNANPHDAKMSAATRRGNHLAGTAKLTETGLKPRARTKTETGTIRGNGKRNDPRWRRIGAAGRIDGEAGRGRNQQKQPRLPKKKLCLHLPRKRLCLHLLRPRRSRRSRQLSRSSPRRRRRRTRPRSVDAACGTSPHHQKHKRPRLPCRRRPTL